MSEYLTVEQVAERLGVEYKTVYWLVRRGELPAGKIGRIYRIHREDLDAFFDRQKQAVAKEARKSGLAGGAGLRCGGCGKAILSELSVGGQCDYCDQEICLACWSIKKIHRCSTHSGAAGEGGPGQRAGRGEADESQAEQLAAEDVVADLRAQGKVAVTGREARTAEEDFLRSFGRRLYEIDELPDPLSGQSIPLRTARVRHELEAADRVSAALPANQITRVYLRTGGWGKPKAALLLEGRFLCRPEVLARQGWDAEPMSESELAPVIDELVKKAKRQDGFSVVLIASPTGWSSEAVEMIRAGGDAALSDPKVAVALWDIDADEVFLDEQDERLRAFWPLVAPALCEAKIADCTGVIREAIAVAESISLAEAIEKCDAPDSWVRMAFARLQQEGEFVVREDPEGEPVISRRPA